MKKTYFAKKALANGALCENLYVTVEDGVITRMGIPDAHAEAAEWIAPGFVDVHVHGGFGFSVMEPTIEGYETWLRRLAAHGTAGVLSAVHTAPVECMREGMAVAKEVMRLQSEGKIGGAKLLGVHLEGPFLSKNAPGAMDEKCMLEPGVEAYESLTEGFGDIVRLITLAPEVEGAKELTAHLVKKGVRVQAGHTCATSEEGKYAFDHGVAGVCHTFNASTKIHHRQPGILAESLINPAVYNEYICDFVHVHPTCVKMIYLCKGAGRMIAITDGVRTAGFPDGEYVEDGRRVIVKDGACYTPSGTLNGGGTTLDKAAQNLVSIGVPIPDALTMASITPSQWLGLSFGSIAEGLPAAFVGLDECLSPLFTVIGTQGYPPQRG